MVAGRDAPCPDDDSHVVSDPASFRDPAGFVYRRDGVLLRQIDRSFGDRWDRVVEGGLLARLEAGGELIPHEVAAVELAAEPARAHAVIRPTEIAFVSYPAEWSFGMLRDAALLTLDVQAEAMAAGFTLRDASAYNVLFDGPRPVLIDHLSFEPATPGTPWPAYRQFCEHFLAPLALMANSIELTRAWVVETLGALADDDEQCARLRETLRVFLSEKGSFKVTAEKLTLHKNTVQYRVRKAEDILGARLDENRLQIELALLACRWLRGAVLRSGPHRACSGTPTPGVPRSPPRRRPIRSRSPGLTPKPYRGRKAASASS